ncbi:MAG: DUF2207 domain-containing protein [Thermodesulfobacteriota bacterium]
MNKLLLLLFFFTFQISFALAGDEIKSFDVDIFLNESGWVKVEENIEYDFKDTFRHGIFREIPYKYKIGNHNYNLNIDIISVRDENGKSYNYNLSRGSGKLNIKIGDPENTVTGINTYIIEYSVENSILFFNDYDEFYWNATGNEWWNIPIAESRAKVYFEQNVPSETKTQCFTGKTGSTNQDCKIYKAEKIITFTSEKTFSGGEGLTIDIALPKGVIKEPSFLSKAFRFIKQNSIYSIPLFVFIFLYGFWKYEGKDPQNSDSIAVMYEPPANLTPAEAGTLFDEKVDMIDITSTVVDLAVRGFLKIEEITTSKFLFLSDKDYKLIKIKNGDGTELKWHEIKILDGIFPGNKGETFISKLRNSFYTHLPGIEESLYKQLVDGQYFPSSPENIRKIFKYFGYGIIFFCIGFLPLFQYKIVGAVFGILFIIFSKYMPRKTKKGAIINNQLMGFREFIERVETDRIKRLSEEDPKVFDKILPYALVFGLEEKWAKAFDELFTEPPSWYYSPNYSGTFNSHIFINDLGRSISIMNKSFYSSPKNANGSRGISSGGGFGGGGFSGGGFGGGGGGSW